MRMWLALLLLLLCLVGAGTISSASFGRANLQDYSIIVNNNDWNNQFRHLQSKVVIPESIYDHGNGSADVFKKADLSMALERGRKVMNLIYQRFEFNHTLWHQFFMGSFNMPTKTWDMLKYKIATRTMANLEKGHKGRFLMIFGGSSVTAGHDNYFHQSYPMVFHRRMKPVFDALGIELFVHNIAQGQNQCRPSDFCYEAMGGSDPDWLGWEQSYNCKGGDFIEIMARTALFNKAIMFYTASGAFIPEDCGSSPDPIPWIDESWTPSAANIQNVFVPDKAYLHTLREQLDSWYSDGNSVSRFTSSLKGKYNGVAPHGFSVWGTSKNKFYDTNRNKTVSKNAIDMRPPCVNNGGAHWMSLEAAKYGVGPNKRTFHPSIGIHMLRGELLAYNYLGAILDAVIMMSEDIASGMSSHTALSKYDKELVALQEPGPEDPLHCDEKECRTRARCWTDYGPHYNDDYYLDSIVVGAHTGWKKVFKSQQYPDKLGYLDTRTAYDSSGPGQEISVKVSIPRDDSVIMLCGYFAKDALKHVFMYLDANVKNPDDSYVSDPKTRTVWPHITYRGDECWNMKQVPKGNYVVTIVTDPQNHDHTSSLSHVITFD